MLVVTTKTDAVARALKRLQSLVRQPRAEDRIVHSGRVPEDIATEDFRWLYLEPDQELARQEARTALLSDLRFEYLARRDAETALWRFACRCRADRAHDHVQPFIREHAREVLHLTCYLPVEYLKVTANAEVAGLRLLPVASDEIPPPQRNFTLDPPVGCVAAVPVSGTDAGRMSDRAHATAEHGLRLLRIALRAGTGINRDQFWFRLGEAYAFDERASGWAQRPGTPYEMTLVASEIDHVNAQLLVALPLAPGNKFERKADLAVRWMERAWLATEPLIRLLYLFFALESLLGDRSEGEKAGLIALRRAMLGEASGRGFTHPSDTYLLYDEVRSAAVHGSEPPELSEDAVDRFARDVRDDLDDYLRYGRDHGFTKQSQLVQALDNHPGRPQMIAWLRVNGGDMWTNYLDKIEHPESARECDG